MLSLCPLTLNLSLEEDPQSLKEHVLEGGVYALIEEVQALVQ